MPRIVRLLTATGATRLCALALLALLLALTGCSSTGSKPGSTAALVPIGAGLDGPAGMQASVYAKGPKTTAAFTFDPQGRLWVSAAGLSTHSEDGVYLIAKLGGRAVRVISGLDDPLGLAWYRGELYVASVGRVDAYGDLHGTHFSEHREVLDGPVKGGENNLLLMGHDGRFLMGVTATCDHCAPKSKWSGSIVSFAPDGGDLHLYARRIRAPFGLAYFPGTDDLFVTMNQRDDLGAQTPGDWLAIVRKGEQWGFPQCYGQGGAACAGVPKPLAVLDKHAAVGGLVITEGQLGRTVGTAALVAEWQSAKVMRVALGRSGSGYRSSVAPFLTGMQNPLALALMPGGSLLVGDWASGTIYRIGPSSR